MSIMIRYDRSFLYQNRNINGFQCMEDVPDFIVPCTMLYRDSLPQHSCNSIAAAIIKICKYTHCICHIYIYTYTRFLYIRCSKNIKNYNFFKENVMSLAISIFQGH